MLKKYSNILLTVALLLFPFFASASVFTQEASVEYAAKQSAAFREAAGYENTRVGNIAANIISVALGLLGIGFIVLIIYGGYTWMMARGNEDEAKKAMNIIQMAVIGLVIVVAAYSITHFVFSSLEEATIGGIGATP